MLEQLEQRLTSYQPWILKPQQALLRQAGVLVLLTDAPDPAVVLTLRGSGLNSHAGEVAFPGGKWEAGDTSILATALRETHEEIGVRPDQVRIIGPLGQVLSKHQLQVTPWVGVIDGGLKLKPNPDEIAEVFSAPLSFLMRPDEARLDRMAIHGKTRYAPAWRYQGYEIWGLTAWVLAEMLNIGFDAAIPTRPRPERVDV